MSLSRQQHLKRAVGCHAVHHRDRVRSTPYPGEVASLVYEVRTKPESANVHLVRFCGLLGQEAKPNRGAQWVCAWNEGRQSGPWFQTHDRSLPSRPFCVDFKHHQWRSFGEGAWLSLWDVYTLDAKTYKILGAPDFNGHDFQATLRAAVICRTYFNQGFYAATKLPRDSAEEREAITFVINLESYAWGAYPKDRKSWVSACVKLYVDDYVRDMVATWCYRNVGRIESIMGNVQS